MTHTTTTLRFANFLAFNVNPTYVAICREVERQLGIPTQFEEGQSFDQFFRREIDVGYVCGLPYSKMSHLEQPPFELLVAPVLCSERYGGQAVYFSDVIVAADSDFQTFADLQNRTFTYNETVSYSGYRLMEFYLSSHGWDWTFFGQRTHSGAHLSSIKDVASGRADTAAIDSHALDAEFKRDPTLQAQIRVIATIGPSPIPPVVVASPLPLGLKSQLRQCYLELHLIPDLQPALQAGCIERFVEVEDSHYDLLRQRIDSSQTVFSSMGC